MKTQGEKVSEALNRRRDVLLELEKEGMKRTDAESS